MATDRTELREAIKKALNVYDVGDHALLAGFPFRVEVEVTERIGRDQYRVTGEGGGFGTLDSKSMRR